MSSRVQEILQKVSILCSSIKIEIFVWGNLVDSLFYHFSVLLSEKSIIPQELLTRVAMQYSLYVHIISGITISSVSVELLYFVFLTFPFYIYRVSKNTDTCFFRLLPTAWSRIVESESVFL